MLSTFLSQLQGYFSKYFILASFFPMLSFAVVNGLVGYFVFDGWHLWIDQHILAASITSNTLAMTGLVVAITLTAYVLSGLSTFLRQVLEGRFLPRFGRFLIPAQNRRREQLIGELQGIAMEMVDLKDEPKWQSQMAEARIAGKRDHAGEPDKPTKPDDLATALEELDAKRRKFEIVEAEKLEIIADKIAKRLKACDFDKSPELVKQQEFLARLILYAQMRAPALHAKLQNELNSNFGAQEVAPSKMGNVANSMQSYALRRYRCNLEIIWSNLMHVVQKDEKAQAALQEAKTQLDFLVACCWLTLVFAVFWSIVFSLVAPSRYAFLGFGIAGPWVTYIWYRAAAEQYRSFADVAMTTFDTFRFDLLHEMRLQMPADVEEERIMWANIDELTTFGENRNFRYDPPKP